MMPLVDKEPIFKLMNRLACLDIPKQVLSISIDGRHAKIHIDTPDFLKLFSSMKEDITIHDRNCSYYPHEFQYKSDNVTVFCIDSTIPEELKDVTKA